MCTASPPMSSPRDLDLAGVQADPDLETEIGRRVSDRSRAADRARRPVEGGEEPVAGRLHFATAERLELVADGGVVIVEELLPTAVAERCRPLGRADDVGEHDRGEHPVGLGCDPRAGQELPDLLDDRVRVAAPGKVVLAGQLARTWRPGSARPSNGPRAS